MEQPTDKSKLYDDLARKLVAGGICHRICFERKGELLMSLTMKRPERHTKVFRFSSKQNRDMMWEAITKWTNASRAGAHP